MKKFYLLSALITSTILLQIISCKKDNTHPPQSNICDVKGTYTGTSVASSGLSSTLTYQLRENNFAVGSETPKGEETTFGGYRNTCDSVIMSVFYTKNSSYYLLQGKLSDDKSTISGTFKNLTNTSDHGTFIISK